MAWLLGLSLTLIAGSALGTAAQESEELFGYKVWIKAFSQESGGFEVVLTAREALRYRVSVAGQLPIPPQKPISPLTVHFSIRGEDTAPVPFQEGGYGFRTVSPSGRARLDWVGKWVGMTVTPPGTAQVRAAFSYQELRDRLVNRLEVLRVEVEGQRIETKNITVLHLTIPLKEILDLQAPPTPKPPEERRKHGKPTANRGNFSPGFLYDAPDPLIAFAPAN